MSFYDCISAVTAALGRKVSMSEFDALYTRLDEERTRLFAQGYPSDWLAASRIVAQQIEIEKAIAQRQVIRNKLVYQDLKSFIANARRTVDAGAALEARMVGINTPVDGGRRSVAAEAHGLWTTAAGALLADLRRGAADGSDRLVKLFSTPAFEIEIAKALRGEKAHPDAVKIGQAIEKTREDLRRQENDAGGWRGKLDGYVTRQSHDSLRLRRAGYEKWKADILPLLDADRTFGRQEELLAQLRQERGQVLQQRLAAGADMAELHKNLEALQKLDRTAGERGARQDDNAAAMRTTFTEALQRFLDAAGKESTPESEAALQQARRDVANTRTGIREMERKAADVRKLQPETRERIEAERAMIDRAAQGIELIDELGQRIKGYEDRLQGPVDPDTFLKRIYNAIAADTWMKGETAKEFTGLMANIGPGNIAKRRAAHRELHFASADAEVGYMRQYGAGGVADTVLREMEGAGSAIALMRGFGPNPQAMFDLARADLLKEANDTGNHKLALAVNRKRLDWQFAEITGAARQTANPTIASWAATIRTVQSIAKLGGAMLSSFGDIATSAAELRYQGHGALTSYASMFEGLMKGRRTGEKRVIADLLGVGFESLTGHILSRLGGESAPPGGLAKASAMFFRLNGLSWWTDAHKTTAGLVISRFFAQESEKSFDKLGKPTQRLLRQYGIADRDWEVLRTAAVHAAEDGTTFLTPEAVKQIPLTSFAAQAEHFVEGAPKNEAPTERALREARDRLASSFSTLVTDRVDFAIPTPGARENAILHMGTQRGDVLGEALRFVMQFKSFNVAMVQKVIGRDFYGQGEIGGSGAAQKLSGTLKTLNLAWQLAAFGYLSMSAKELLAGKNPRDPATPETVAAALMQGGGMGIMGDFAFGQFNRFGQSALATAAGPTLGTASDLFDLWATAHDPDKWRRGGVGADIAAHSLRLLASNTPYASLWWLRPAFNYLALYPVQEKLNPGYLRRMEGRIQRENKQTFWLSPQEAPRL